MYDRIIIDSTPEGFADGLLLLKGLPNGSASPQTIIVAVTREACAELFSEFPPAEIATAANATGWDRLERSAGRRFDPAKPRASYDVVITAEDLLP